MLLRLLALLLLAIPGVAHADWYEASTQHFVVLSNDKPEVVKQFATNLERFDKALRFLRNLSDEPVGKANRVTIFVVDDVATVAKLAHMGAAAGFYSARAGGSVAFVPRKGDDWNFVPQEFKEMELSPIQILLHEYTHHFLLSLSPDVAYPAWFVEGYAEFFAPSVFEPDGSMIIGRPPMYRTMDLFGQNALPVERMLTAEPSKLTGEQRYLMYGRGWLLTHYLFLSGKRQGQLGAYFRALTEGKPPAEAAKAFGDPRQLDAELYQYKRLDFPAERIPASALQIGDIALRKLGPVEAAVMPVRIRSKAGVNKTDAPDVYADAKNAAAPFPNDPAAQLMLAEAAYDAEDYPAADAAATRALAADPRSVDALLYQARARMAAAVKAKDMTPATWDAIRVVIARANRLDTEDPRPLLAYFQSYAQPGQPMPKVARDGLYYAYALAPQDVSLRFTTATAYLRDGNVPMARAMLMTIAANPHSATGTASLASKLVASIDAGHPEQAIAELDKPQPAEGKDDGKDGGKKPPAAKKGS